MRVEYGWNWLSILPSGGALALNFGFCYRGFILVYFEELLSKPNYYTLTYGLTYVFLL
jgi:hypothetical protein